jgi:serine/threonine-protein kinase RsbW
MTERQTESASQTGKGYRIELSVHLPRDTMSVPVIRHLTRHTLDEVGAREDICSDIEVALTEACANVLYHSGPGDAYDVTVTIGPQNCELRIIDVGYGFDHKELSLAATTTVPDLSAEHGRGLALIHAVVDKVELVSVPEEGTLVCLIKRLEFDDNAPARKLLAQALAGGDAQAAQS